MEVVRQRIMCCSKTFCLKCWGAGSYIRETRIKAEKEPGSAIEETGSTDENH